MHEYSIVQALLNQSEEHARANGAERITKVVVKIGVMSGVEPDLLQSAFDTFKEGTMCDGAVFVINMQPILIRCHTCNTESEIGREDYSCPQCGSTDLSVLDGEEMYLMQLELDGDDENDEEDKDNDTPKENPDA
jgi:hydrogenase nickel incorporation protein HypA/HybF